MGDLERIESEAKKRHDLDCNDAPCECHALRLKEEAAVDELIAMVKKLGDHEQLYVKTELKYQQARADVAKLRDIVRRTQHEKGHHKRASCNCDGCTALADTAHYEDPQ